MVEANAIIAHALYQKDINGDVTAMIFWLKCRADDRPPFGGSRVVHCPS